MKEAIIDYLETFSVHFVEIYVVRLNCMVYLLSIYQFSRHPQSFGSGRHLRRSFMAQRRPRVNQESLPRASLAG